MADAKISELTLGTPADTDVIPFVDLATGTTKKATKTDLKGAQGAQGVQGSVGSAGSQGAQGAQGQTGAQGSQGNTGSQGATGVQGATGSQGSQGNQGTQGVQGSTGTQGATGSQGSQGAQGAQGVQGAQGNQGTQGTQGNQGYQGNQGAAAMAGTAMLGEIYVADNVTAQTATNQNTWYKWTTGYASGQSSNATLSTGNGNITALAAGGVKISVTGSISANANAQVLEVAVFKNDVYQTDLSCHITIPASGDYHNFAISGLSNFSINDVIDVRINNTTSAGKNITIQEVQLSMTAVSGAQGATGSQGAQGLAGGSISWKGAWSGATAYVINDGVSDNGSSYACILSHTNHQPPNGTYWQLLADKGSQGNQGVQGSTGAQGATGSQGSQGNQGTQGAQGSTGSQGNQGNQGTQGVQGSQGAQGAQGSQGSLTVTAAPGSDHTASGLTITLTAAVALNFGDVGYIDTNGKVALIDADAIANCSGIVMCADTSIAQDAAGTFILHGIARDDTWNFTVGGLIYASTTGTTGNTITQTAPSGTDDVIQVLGVATHADRMYFNPQLVQIEHT